MNTELLSKVESTLEKIRPYLLADGGDVKILEITDSGKLIIEFEGACGSCPMSSMTFKAGIEEAVKRDCPEITAVEAVNITAPNDPRAQLPNTIA
ncbi:MAG: NifU family protein [Bacteroidota bacterium]